MKNSSQQSHCIACDQVMGLFIKKIWDDRYGYPGIFAIDRCTGCGQMMTVPRLMETDLPELYSQYYPRRNIDFVALELEAEQINAPLSKLRRWLSGTNNQGHYLAKPREKVLDIGSGSCLSLLELRKMGVEAYGVEADPNVREIAERYKLQVHIGSVHDNPFADEFFDLIVLNQVIEHVPDPSALLGTVRERLKPDGRLILSFPNTGSLNRMLSGHRWINWHVPYHQHHFNRRSFAVLASRHGFNIDRARTITPNLWTTLQIRANREQPAEGHASDCWSPPAPMEKTHIRFLHRLMNALAYRFAKGFGWSIVIANRIVDIAGYGDSLLVELSKKQSSSQEKRGAQ